MPIPDMVTDLAAGAATTVASHLGLRIPVKTGVQLTRRFASHPDRLAFLRFYAGMNVRSKLDPTETESLATPSKFNIEINSSNAWGLFQSIGTHPHSGDKASAKSAYQAVDRCLHFITNDINNYISGVLTDRDPVRIVEIGTSCASMLRFFQFDPNVPFERTLEESLIFLLADIESIANDIQYFERTQSFHDQYGSKYSPSLARIATNKASFRLAKSSAFIRLDPSHRIDDTIIYEALSCGAINTAHYTLSTALKQLATVGEFDKAIFLAQLNTRAFRDHIWVNYCNVASLHGEEPSSDHSPGTSLGALYVAHAGVMLSHAVNLSHAERRTDIREARRLLIKSDAHFFSVSPPWKHGLAGLYSTAAVAAFLSDNLVMAKKYILYSSRYYSITKDMYRKRIVDTFGLAIDRFPHPRDLSNDRVQASLLDVLLKD